MVVMIRKTGPKKTNWEQMRKRNSQDCKTQCSTGTAVVTFDCSLWLPPFLPSCSVLKPCLSCPWQHAQNAIETLCNALQSNAKPHCFPQLFYRGSWAIFLLAQSSYWPQTITSFKRQFLPKWVKNQAKGSKIHKIRTKWHPTYCGNPSILSSELLWESTNSVLRATVGIHCIFNTPSLLQCQMLLWFKLSTCKWKWNFVSIDIFTSGDLAK